MGLIWVGLGLIWVYLFKCCVPPHALPPYCKGKRTKLAMLDGNSSHSKRKMGNQKNAAKCMGIGHGLLQYFVDEVQSLASRADSVMLLDKAKQLRFQLLQDGFMESDLPKMEGRPGINWFARWRKEHALIVKGQGLQLKVAWSKILRRCRVLLTNIFRLMIFLAMCHPGQLQCVTKQ